MADSNNKNLMTQKENGNCPFLGIEDDPSTCMAYPSPNNYCHHAKPIGLPNLDHQLKYCLSSNHAECPVFLSKDLSAFPKDFGSGEEEKFYQNRSKWIFIPVILIPLLIAAFFLWRAIAGGSLPMSGMNSTLLPSETALITNLETTETVSTPLAVSETPLSPTSTIESPTETMQSTPTMELDTTLTPLSSTATMVTTPLPSLSATPTLEPATQTATATITATATQTITPTPVNNICGYQLEKAFGVVNKYIIHQVLDGESFGLYTSKYNITIDAIKAVNYDLPIPLVSNTIIILPIKNTDIKSSPKFAPYYVFDKNETILDLAQKLSIDPTDLKNFNEFNDSCEFLYGWILIPKEYPQPTTTPVE